MTLPTSPRPAGKAPSNRRSTAHKVFTLVLTALVLLPSAPPVHGFPDILNDFMSRYPASNSVANAGCQVCHGSCIRNCNTWNEYGWNLRLAGWNFAALENLPSVNVNGGTTYLDEINASTQPGWTTGAHNNLYTISGLLSSTRTPPSSINGNLDPPLGNQPPVANDDDYTTPFQTQLIVVAPGVLGNDSDAEGATLTAVLESDVSDGILSLNEDGSFIYAPNTGFSGIDTLTYVANDGIDDSNVATVTITVGAADSDEDGIDDNLDNCITVSNGPDTPGITPDQIQRDTDGDGIGNICDADFNNDAIVGPADLSLFKAAYGSTNSADEDQDLDGDGIVGPADLSLFKSYYGKPPGPPCCDMLPP